MLMAWIDNAPQTNEVRRSAALILAGHWLGTQSGLPLMLSEVGASAGLNMVWDRYALQAGPCRLGPDDAALTLTPDWTGPAPVASEPRIVDRRGADLNPLSPAAPADATRLLAYLWPDQPHRADLTRAAIAAATAQQVEIDRADALEWLPARLQAQPPGTLHLIYHTVAWQYLPDTARAKGEALIAEAGARATPDRPLARFGMEADGKSPGAAMVLQTWPDGRLMDLGRIDFHGRWIQWAPPSV